MPGLLHISLYSNCIIIFQPQKVFEVIKFKTFTNYLPYYFTQHINYVKRLAKAEKWLMYCE